MNSPLRLSLADKTKSVQRQCERFLNTQVAGHQPADYHLKTGGSRTRMNICIDASLSLGLSDSDAVRLSASIELMHNASLVHDDIQEHAHSMSIALINNLARLYSLSVGLTVPNTVERLNLLGQIGIISKEDAINLRDIWLFLNRLRWRHQLRNNVTDNIISVSELSSLEKHQLKASFKAIHRAQQAVVMKLSGGIA